MHRVDNTRPCCKALNARESDIQGKVPDTPLYRQVAAYTDLAIDALERGDDDRAKAALEHALLLLPHPSAGVGHS